MAIIEGEDNEEREERGREGAGWETEGRGAAWFAARLKTSRGESDSWWDGGAVPGGGSRSWLVGTSGGADVGGGTLCGFPPAARMMSTASSTLCLRESSLARRSRSCAGVSSSNIPVILLAREGLND